MVQPRIVRICGLPIKAFQRDYIVKMASFISPEPTEQRLPAYSEPRRARSVARRALFAGIDLGTNNCRMLLGTPQGTGFQVLDSFSRVVRLGEGLYETGKLSPAAMDRAIEALMICANRAKRWGADAAGGRVNLRAIATEACRQAENGAAFVARARAETGLNLEIISPREEAELAVESCTSLICKAGRRAVLFDIGGGSTEIAGVDRVYFHSCRRCHTFRALRSGLLFGGWIFLRGGGCGGDAAAV
jgi:exopolyphosphatase/guanosine-5'-triphosphate,3'-diphosphate pyrophosphatase